MSTKIPLNSYQAGLKTGLGLDLCACDDICLKLHSTFSEKPLLSRAEEI